jgi:hypothetical protein
MAFELSRAMNLAGRIQRRNCSSTVEIHRFITSWPTTASPLSSSPRICRKFLLCPIESWWRDKGASSKRWILQRRLKRRSCVPQSTECVGDTHHPRLEWSTSRLNLSACALDLFVIACPFRKTGFHFSGTCSGRDQPRYLLMMPTPSRATVSGVISSAISPCVMM